MTASGADAPSRTWPCRPRRGPASGRPGSRTSCVSGAGSAPERSTATRSLASCWSWNGSPKPPRVMRPRAADAALDDRRRVDLLVEDDGHLAADVVAGQAFSEMAAPWRSNLNETSGRPVCWSQVWSAFDEVLAGQLGALVQVVGAPVACPASARRPRRARASPRSRSRDRAGPRARRSAPAKNFSSASRLFERR